MAWATELRNAAVEAAEHGWPIQPGTYRVHGSSSWLGKDASAGLEPVAECWTQAGITDPDTALNLWTQRPYAIIMACGLITDAIVVPAYVGGRVAQPLSAAGCLPPIIVNPFGTWLLLVQPGQVLRRELVGRLGIGYRCRGSWIALPPTDHAGPRYQWRVHPRDLNWSLPTAANVQAVLVDMLTSTYHRRTYIAGQAARLPQPASANWTPTDDR